MTDRSLVYILRTRRKHPSIRFLPLVAWVRPKFGLFNRLPGKVKWYNGVFGLLSSPPWPSRSTSLGRRTQKSQREWALPLLPPLCGVTWVVCHNPRCCGGFLGLAHRATGEEENKRDLIQFIDFIYNVHCLLSLMWTQHGHKQFERKAVIQKDMWASFVLNWFPIRLIV